MKIKYKKTVIFLIIIAALFAAHSYNTVSGTWNYKITVAIETPEGVKTGSAVRQISNSASRYELIDLPDTGNPADEAGEAVVIDLGERGKLFALISGNSEQELYTAFPTEAPSTFEGIKYYNSLLVGKKAELMRKRPSLVMFKDITNPLSVVLINDDSSIENAKSFEEAFGQGVRLQNVTIEITDKPVTERIISVLPWLSENQIGGGYLHGEFTSRVSPYGLHGGHFKREK